MSFFRPARSGMLLALLTVFCVAPAPAADAPGPLVNVRLVAVDWPRNFGYRIGDTVPVRATIAVAPGWAPDRDGLPEPGQGDRQFELRALDSAVADCAHCIAYTLEWQLMKSVRTPQTLRLPPTALRFRRGGEVAEVMLPAFELSSAPLLHWQAKKDWIDSVHPGYRATGFDLRAPLVRAGLWALAALALLGAALWASGRLGARRSRPFARAWREVHALGRRDDDAARALALRALHRACNETAGRSVFALTLPDFLRETPELADLADDLQAAFAASRALFYGLPAPAGQGGVADLRRLLRALRDRERLFGRRPVPPPAAAMATS